MWRNSFFFSKFNIIKKVPFHNNEEAFRELYEHYKNRVYGFVLTMVHDTEAAEELTQEVFIKLWTSRASLAQVKNLEGYIFTTTRNKTLNYLRKAAHDAQLLQHLQWKMNQSENNVEEQMDIADHYQIMEEAINQLSAQRRRVFILSRYEGMNLEEIAQQLHLSRNTIKNHLGASLRFIRTYLSKHDMLLPALLLFFLK